MKYDFFISYSDRDREWAINLGSVLRQKGFKIFDMTTVKPGEPLVEALEAGLRESKNLLLVVSKDSVNSNWVAVELGAALALKKSVIPIISSKVALESLPAPIKRRKFLPMGVPAQVAEQIISGLDTNGKRKHPVESVRATRLVSNRAKHVA